MKKLIAFLMCFMLCSCFAVSAFAEDAESKIEEEPKQETAVETTQDMSSPRVMVIGYELDKESLTPEETAKLKITFKNFSSTKAIKNIKLTLDDPSGEIRVNGMASCYVPVVYAGSTYTWTLEIIAAKTANVGLHDLQFSAEYEDVNFSAYSATDTIRINVKQTMGLTYDGIMLPSVCVQGETVTITSNFMNSGKSLVRNLTITCDIKGLESGGSTFVGEVPVGESTSAGTNLRTSSEMTGAIDGTVTITYENELGEKFKETVNVSSVIKEKSEVTTVSDEDEEESAKKGSVKWIFLALGAVIGGGLGYGIPTAIRNKKQRDEDEKRL
ncbi:MAG: hypothetical protein NC122_01715 [Faecalibacterium sp.]|nr:hypothetical protein [Ruminococcus sp.]MCM1391341.1 hypothetical protein [Ruminococcus sp.]MCM1484900.1 hypothetical protein [Faecalibacterium sp.]